METQLREERPRVLDAATVAPSPHPRTTAVRLGKGKDGAGRATGVRREAGSVSWEALRFRNTSNLRNQTKP